MADTEKLSALLGPSGRDLWTIVSTHRWTEVTGRTLIEMVCDADFCQLPEGEALRGIFRVEMREGK